MLVYSYLAGPCAASYCNNNGYCHTDGNSDVCFCKLGFYGLRCDTRKFEAPYKQYDIINKTLKYTYLKFISLYVHPVFHAT